ncbi:hypothetical protein [Enteroccous phage Ef212]|nr:hypothetical protein [Enteroccous phage Ef212]
MFIQRTSTNVDKLMFVVVLILKSSLLVLGWMT